MLIIYICFLEAVKKPGYLEIEWPNNENFKKKIVEETRLHLDLHIEFEKLNPNNYKTPMELIMYEIYLF